MKSLIKLLIALLGLIGLMFYAAADEYFAHYGFITIDGEETEGRHCLSRGRAPTCDDYAGNRYFVKEYWRKD